MEQTRLRVIDTMNTLERARALEGVQQAMVLVNLAGEIASRVRGALRSAWQAMTLVYGRKGS